MPGSVIRVIPTPLGHSVAKVVRGSTIFEDAQSCYLTRTPSTAGNKRTSTRSYWIKFTQADDDYDVPPRYFLDPEYDEDFDMFLYTVVGYPVLLTMTYDIFTSPYAITSLREYFAKGFEEFFLGDQKNLKEISPVLYNRLLKVTENES